MPTGNGSEWDWQLWSDAHRRFLEVLVNAVFGQGDLNTEVDFEEVCASGPFELGGRVLCCCSSKLCQVETLQSDCKDTIIRTIKRIEL